MPLPEALLRCGEAAEFGLGFPARVVITQTILFQRVGFQFKVRLDLFGKIVVAASAPEHP
ncbi:MAG TPA: hypothetical protein VGJ21_13105 [Terracidiphilus sp.]